MKHLIISVAVFFIIALIVRGLVLGFIPVYEIIGAIGSLCFITCAFILGFYVGQGKKHYDRDMKINQINLMRERMK